VYKPTAENDNLTELSRLDGVAEFDNVHGNTYEDGRQVTRTALCQNCRDPK
jgi:hypothetical protein